MNGVVTDLAVFPSRSLSVANSRHITVCVCTFRRPALLRRALEGIARQRTNDTLTFAVVVADNDINESARAVAHEFAGRSKIGLTYCVEPRQNIALARNRALAEAHGEFVAFIDDDESPSPEWLGALVDACDAYKSAGALGPVHPEFEQPPPRWVLKGGFCERPVHQTGQTMLWQHTRTGNVLLRRAILGSASEPFDPLFSNGGEDIDFFRRMTGDGHVFVWCNEAVVYEVVPPDRLTRGYMLRRALLRGRNTLKLPGRRQSVARSFAAVPLYVAALPFTLFRGQHVFMKFAISLCDHLGRLLGLVGLNPVNKRGA
jgi:succinoglycan biosynthesis protein ExoM